jgi:predicted nucleic acid-binding protein
MKAAYLDTSVLIAIAFEEKEGLGMARRIAEYDRLYSSNLLEAEFKSVLLREAVDASPRDYLAPVGWILPDRPLTAEIERASSAGYLRGADLWHLACALHLCPDPGLLAFLTLDRRQRAAARKLGFAVE